MMLNQKVLKYRVTTKYMLNGNMSNRSQLGFAYIWILGIMILLSLGIGQWAINYATLKQRENEQELLRIGRTYQNAIKNYYENTPGGVKIYPSELNDLLKDPRHLSVTRYMRKLEKDPITGDDFLIIRNLDHLIIGVYSRSDKTPIKKDGFDEKETSFRNSNHYNEWKFLVK